MAENKNNKNNDKKRLLGVITVYLIIGLIIFFIIRGMTVDTTSLTISYTEFVDLVDRGKISKVLVKDTGSLSIKTIDGQTYELFAPILLRDANFIDKLIEKNIEVDFKQDVTSGWLYGILSYVIPFIILIFLWMIMLRPLTGRGPQGMNFTKSPARKYDPEKERVTFDDVAGVDEAREELDDIVKFLKNPQVFNKIGARMPKGILLVGPPGTGKTLIARAVAGEARVPFFYISGSDFVELFVGVGAARVRDLFTQAKANAPAIIFIDEIDAVGRQRGAGLGGGHDEREQTLNQLLVEMDGFDPRAGIIIMAATNRPDILDKALLRPGRFDKKIILDMPDVKGREQILKIHMKGKPISPNIDIEVLARRTPGFSGADLENLINEAALLSARKGKKIIEMDELEEAIDRVIAGPARKSRIISKKTRKIIAYHELGHAIVGALLPNADPVHKVTIVPRGHQALGFTLQLPLEDKYLMTKEEILDRITGILGGRAAEELVFNQITSGAANDLQKATEYARIMILKFGMSERLGPIAWGSEEEEVFLGKELAKMKNYSEETASEIDNEIKRIIIESYDKAKKILEENEDKLHEIAKVLLEKETLSGEELNEMLGVKKNGSSIEEVGDNGGELGKD
ncbi:cell division protease FtsH [Marinitoga hydrogenitolerans DSM 16785]|uniref:ATP-dependent zinc metalloprotease FtsH n=1 Tax=Marinitoga hydrogenitolerans (strain DSM 16785 / JCM 12826 / AT1271) TaxID=1122195 RepID=A0A1M4X0F6_MARH1|nr:ATP-dependent zinc metalloprotease FtsH [Marinitoga hydrogenitolerans]SHE86935.1 cell division protease FtsH [Marinitoga hydrogenitolerans DSM 16785]